MGKSITVDYDLLAIGTLKDKGNSTYTVHNYDGELTPIVHQGDRIELAGYRHFTNNYPNLKFWAKENTRV